MVDHSVLGPIRADSIPTAEKEKAAPWIVRRLVGSMTGRVVMSSYESLRAAGTSVVCLSPWGDSSPLLLPCIRFRDLAVHTVIVATGGVGAIAAPVMGPVSDLVVSSLGDTILVEIGVHAGFELTAKAANDMIFDKVDKMLPIHSKLLETTGVKSMLITLRYKHTIEDAALGFYRSSFHEDSSLFANVMDYLAVEKGWFSPYLFASGRRPIIPRSMKPDIVFCHGPFLEGDYRIGETILAQSAAAIVLCPAPPPAAPSPPHPTTKSSFLSVHQHRLPSLSNAFPRSRSPSPPPELTTHDPPPTPRRMVLSVVGLTPHRKFWTTSARPGESVIHYQLLNGCPAVVVPVKVGAPLVAWDTLTLEELWKVPLPEPGDIPEVVAGKASGSKFHGIVGVLYEYLDLCIDWERVVVPNSNSNLEGGGGIEEAKATAVRDALVLLVAGAVRSGASKKVRHEVDHERSGIAMWRIP